MEFESLPWMSLDTVEFGEHLDYYDGPLSGHFTSLGKNYWYSLYDMKYEGKSYAYFVYEMPDEDLVEFTRWCDARKECMLKMNAGEVCENWKAANENYTSPDFNTYIPVARIKD